MSKLAITLFILKLIHEMVVLNCQIIHDLCIKKI